MRYSQAKPIYPKIPPQKEAKKKKAEKIPFQDKVYELRLAMMQKRREEELKIAEEARRAEREELERMVYGSSSVTGDNHEEEKAKVNHDCADTTTDLLLHSA